ncbi:uncharacterized protein LOC130711876 [Lotus japonicus]|uniref:uncharacterized protein LOC130711876 n=1 Tax=Lotus japonicus TaxID=34305 RepID=UPI00258E413C|nr:uncharacterized protein LOC130711876 [Lotus japonicus]
MDRIIGGGGTIRDHRGRWVVGCYSREEGDTAFKVEALALRDVLVLVWDRGSRQIICDVDCDELVRVVVDAEAVQLHSEFLVLNVTHQLLAREWNVKLNGVHRDSNAVADYLARRGAAASAPGFWVMENPDPDVEYLLLKDSLSVP